MLRDLSVLLGIGCIWLIQYLATTFASATLPTLWLETSKVFFSAVTLGVICYSTGLSSRAHAHWSKFILIGILQATIPLVLMPWGDLRVDQAVPAVLLGTIPLYLAILAPMILQNVAVERRNYFGITLGLAVLVMLFYPELAGFSNASLLVFVGILFAVAISVALVLLTLPVIKQEHPMIVARNVLCINTTQVIFVSLVIHPDTLTNIALPTILELLHGALLIASILYFLYDMALRRQKSERQISASSFYLILSLGILVNAVLHHQSIQPTTWAAFIIISIAVILQITLSPKDSNDCLSNDA